MGYANISFRLTDDEKDSIREIAEARGVTMSRLCGEVMRENCLDCETIPGKQVLGEGDILAIAEAIRDELNFGGSGSGSGELPQSEKLEQFIRKAVDKNNLSRQEVVGRLLSYAIRYVSPEPDFMSTAIGEVKNKL